LNTRVHGRLSTVPVTTRVTLRASKASPVNTARATLSKMTPVFTCRIDGPSTRPVNTGSVDKVPVSTGHVGKNCTTMFFFNTALNTGRVLGRLSSLPVNTARQHECPLRHPCRRPINTASEHGSCAPTFTCSSIRNNHYVSRQTLTLLFLYYKLFSE